MNFLHVVPSPAMIVPFARNVGFLALFFGCLLTVGCGGSATEQQAAQTADTSQQLQQSAPLEPTAIVSQFLDRVRRGGNDSGASELLTKLAQQEMTRIGRPLQFPGSPDTQYKVLQSFPIPNQSDAVWVQTYLSEPAETGQQMQYEVVWTLRNESDGWRISGFAIDQGNELEPMRIDFENGAEMEARLATALGDTESENR
ncbi:hypothetical protein NHH03_11725 [Stieleria sp. TO1_6]|uniref:hypothetical protein n=1 Tax=Stieleria tagensis TaxID=2956795 RepID=UPI00209AE2B7|nr:hypothetical protein [Stieleria tagensis]MCO8122407.1 hypothetical protein [Stieleria tagensis]